MPQLRREEEEEKKNKNDISAQGITLAKTSHMVLMENKYFLLWAQKSTGKTMNETFCTEVTQLLSEVLSVEATGL